MVDDVRWWVGCVVMFTLLIVLATDIFLFARFGGHGTVSASIARYVGQSRESVASALLGFIFGGLLVQG